MYPLAGTGAPIPRPVDHYPEIHHRIGRSHAPCGHGFAGWAVTIVVIVIIIIIIIL